MSLTLANARMCEAMVHKRFCHLVPPTQVAFRHRTATAISETPYPVVSRKWKSLPCARTKSESHILPVWIQTQSCIGRLGRHIGSFSDSEMTVFREIALLYDTSYSSFSSLVLHLFVLQYSGLLLPHVLLGACSSQPQK